MDALPDFESLSDDDLARLIRATEEEEEAISIRRRYLHGRIDLLRHARVERLRSHVESGTLDLQAPASLDRSIFEGSGSPPEENDATLPDVATLSDDELRSLVLELEREEDDISLHRRVLHGRIDILRAERERRRRGGQHVEPTDLGPILGGSSR